MMDSFVARGGWWVVAQSILMLAVLAGGVAIPEYSSGFFDKAAQHFR